MKIVRGVPTFQVLLRLIMDELPNVEGECAKHFILQFAILQRLDLCSNQGPCLHHC